MRLKPRHKAKAKCWADSVMVAPSMATHFMFPGIAGAQDAVSVGHTRGANRNADATVPTGWPDGAPQVGGDPLAADVTEEVTRLVVGPSDPLGTVDRKRLHQMRPRSRSVNEVERIAEPGRRFPFVASCYRPVTRAGYTNFWRIGFRSEDVTSKGGLHSRRPNEVRSAKGYLKEGE